MLAATLFGLSALFLLLAVHPYLTYPLSLEIVKGSRRRLRYPDPEPAIGAPSFAICTCAYNEEDSIEQKVKNHLAFREEYPSLQILFYVDASSDSTAAILERYADQITLVISEKRLGKTAGMNKLVALTDADIVVFTDANVMLDRGLLSALSRHFADPATGCVCGNLCYVNGAESSVAETGSLYWRLEQKIKRLESRWSSVMGADGSIFAIRRELHIPPPAHIIDDMYVSFQVMFQGFGLIQADDVRAYEKSVSIAEEEFRRKIRIACQAFNVHRILWSHIKAMDPLWLYMYVSHKLLRWFSIYFLAAAALFVSAGLVAAGQSMLLMICIAAGLIALIVSRKWKVPLLSQVVDILMAFVGTGIGILQSISGHLYQTWTPANSIRKTA
jgi:cellulose synthase/poly-beta-1,6-N-acetylglucosamine synthase-like glycosyltransferase